MKFDLNNCIKTLFIFEKKLKHSSPIYVALLV